MRSNGAGIANGYDGPGLLRVILWIFALFGGIYGLGLMIAPELLTSFWPWEVDAFHGRMYAAAFVTPAIAAWLLSFRRRFAIEYLSLGLNLVVGGILTILGTLWTNTHVSPERQIDFSASGTWAFLTIFFLTGILGIVLITSAIQLSRKASVTT
jgi:uncharacterized membrane protein YhaH (DUF805 family)